MNTNGILSFRTPFLNSTTFSFPLSTRDILIAPFWADVDIRSSGNVFFRFSVDPVLLNQVGLLLTNSFGSEVDPLSLFIVTWDDVPGADFPDQVLLQAEKDLIILSC